MTVTAAEHAGHSEARHIIEAARLAHQRPPESEWGTVMWACDPRFILCPSEHLYRFKEHGMVRDHRRLSGHEFFRCEECHPKSHFFAVFTTTPDPVAFCYLISEECWRTWMAETRPSLPTMEMLYLLRDPAGRSYNPHWKPR